MPHFIAMIIFHGSRLENDYLLTFPNFSIVPSSAHIFVAFLSIFSDTFSSPTNVTRGILVVMILKGSEELNFVRCDGDLSRERRICPRGLKKNSNVLVNSRV